MSAVACLVARWEQLGLSLDSYVSLQPEKEVSSREEREREREKERERGLN
jgi:hypothetical protein